MIRTDIIKDLRIRNGYTLKEIADKLKISEATAQRYETAGIKTVPYDNIVALADIYGCDPAYIMGWQAEYRISDLKPIEELNADEMEILKAYRAAPDSMKEGVKRFLGIEKG